MRVVLYTEGEFNEALRAAILPWARRYAESLQRSGLNVTFFRREAPALQRTDVVHVFGCAKPENWFWLKQSAQAVVVSPLPGERIPAAHPLRGKLQSLLGRRLNSDTFRSAVNAFHEISPAEDPASTASRMVPVYAELSRNT